MNAGDIRYASAMHTHESAVDASYTYLIVLVGDAGHKPAVANYKCKKRSPDLFCRGAVWFEIYGVSMSEERSDGAESAGG